MFWSLERAPPITKLLIKLTTKQKQGRNRLAKFSKQAKKH